MVIVSRNLFISSKTTIKQLLSTCLHKAGYDKINKVEKLLKLKSYCILLDWEPVRCEKVKPKQNC